MLEVAAASLRTAKRQSKASGRGNALDCTLSTTGSHQHEKTENVFHLFNLGLRQRHSIITPPNLQLQ